MKNLLIILISFLLLSSPVIGEEVGVLYQYETSSGIKWKTFGDGKVQPKYKGEIKNGIMDGLGVLTYPYGEKSVVGEWKNGKEWNTKHTKKDGTPIGKFENGEYIWGVLYEGVRYSDGLGYGWYEEKLKGKNRLWGIYRGDIKNRLPNGSGEISYVDSFSDGETYVGSWKDGELINGTYTYYGGRKFVGEFKYDRVIDVPFPWNGTTYDKNGNIKGKYVNGEWIQH